MKSCATGSREKWAIVAYCWTNHDELTRDPKVSLNEHVYSCILAVWSVIATAFFSIVLMTVWLFWWKSSNDKRKHPSASAMKIIQSNTIQVRTDLHNPMGFIAIRKPQQNIWEYPQIDAWYLWELSKYARPFKRSDARAYAVSAHNITSDCFVEDCRRARSITPGSERRMTHHQCTLSAPYRSSDGIVAADGTRWPAISAIH